MVVFRYEEKSRTWVSFTRVTKNREELSHQEQLACGSPW